ncbi:MAG TPA: hypothetical protein VHO28_09730 [Ignavibacteriales bacterium]|nr:hypothetical protein [Ignavibacteriales bacterium]
MSEPQKIKRILMTADPIGGIWSFSLDLAGELSKHNVDVHLAVMGGPLNARQKREAEILPNLRIYESSYKLEWMNEPWQDVDEAGGWLLNLEGEIEPDIIHLNGYSHASFSFSAPKLIVAHSCVNSGF